MNVVDEDEDEREINTKQEFEKPFCLAYSNSQEQLRSAS